MKIEKSVGFVPTASCVAVSRDKIIGLNPRLTLASSRGDRLIALGRL